MAFLWELPGCGQGIAWPLRSVPGGGTFDWEEFGKVGLGQEKQ